MNPLTEGKRIKLGYDYFATGFSGTQLSEAYYRLIADKKQERLLFETATIDEVDEVYNPDDENDRLTTEELILEAIRIQRFNRTESKMAALVRVFNGHMKDKNIEALVPVIGKPKKSGLFATVTVQIPLSDGQVVSIIFHSPDNNKMKIAADDEIIAFRWLLNKRDITQVVSPENDAEVSLQEIGKRIAQLVEKNSARFQVMQKELVAQRKMLEELKVQADEGAKRHFEIMGTLKEEQDAIEGMDARISTLQGQIGKQKTFNDGLREKIDALKAQQAGNAGKAVGGKTPKTEAEMKAEQERAAYEDAKASYEANLKAMGFVPLLGEEATFYLDVVDTTVRHVKRMRRTIRTNYYDAEGKVVVNADKPTFSALLKNAASAFKKAISALANEKAKHVTVAEWLMKYKGITDQFKVGSRWAILKNPSRPEDGSFNIPAIVTAIGKDVSNSYLPGVTFQVGETTVIGYDYQDLTENEASGAVKPWDENAPGSGESDYQKERAERDKQVDEYNRLVAVGHTAVPGIRLQDAEEAGKLWEMKGRGELSQEEWDKYVEDLKASNKIRQFGGPPVLVGPTMTSDEEERVLAALATLGEEELTRRHNEIRAYMEGPDFKNQPASYMKSLENTEFLLFTAKKNAPDEPAAVTVLFEDAKERFVQELTSMGFSSDGPESFRLDVIDNEKNRYGQRRCTSIKTSYYVAEGKVFVTAAEQQFSELLKDAAGAFKKAINVLVEEKSRFSRTFADWMAQYGGVASQFKVGEEWAIAKDMKNPKAGTHLVPAVVAEVSDKLLGSILPRVRFWISGAGSDEDYDYEELTRYLASGALKPWADLDAQTKAESDKYLKERAEREAKADEKRRLKEDGNKAVPAAVTVLNDILSGKYDGDSTKLGEALDQAAADLEKEGKAEQYDALLNKAADYLTEILKKEAA